MKTTERTEHQEQTAFFAWVDLKKIKTTELENIFAIPNGGLRNIVVAKKLKAEGVKAGVPDIFLAVARGGYHGLFIEMKREKSGKLSDVQDGWMARLEYHNYCFKVCHGFNAAIEAVENYLELNG